MHRRHRLPRQRGGQSNVDSFAPAVPVSRPTTMAFAAGRTNFAADRDGLRSRQHRLRNQPLRSFCNGALVNRRRMADMNESRKRRRVSERDGEETPGRRHGEAGQEHRYERLRLQNAPAGGKVVHIGRFPPIWPASLADPIGLLALARSLATSIGLPALPTPLTCPADLPALATSLAYPVGMPAVTCLAHLACEFRRQTRMGLAVSLLARAIWACRRTRP